MLDKNNHILIIALKTKFHFRDSGSPSEGFSKYLSLETGKWRVFLGRRKIPDGQL